MGEQVVEEQHRLRRERQLGVPEPRPAGDPVHQQRPRPQPGRGRQRTAPGPGPAHDRPQPGQQLVRVERFVEIVVGPLIQGDRALAGLAHLREQHDRQPAAVGPQAAQDLPAVEPGQQHVEDTAVRVQPLYQVQRGLAVGGDVNAEPGPFQERGQVGRDGLVVIDEDHDRACARPAGTRSRGRSHTRHYRH